MKAFATFAAIFIFASISIFAEVTEKKLEKTVLLGIDLGYSRVQSDVFTEANKNGFQVSPLLLGSLSWQPWVFDLGGGWIWNRSRGSRDVITNDTITSYGFLSHAAIRYQWGRHHWGLLNENAFADNFNFGGDTSPTSVAVFVGPQYLYAWTAAHLQWRAGVSALTDVTISDRQVYLALAQLQVGLGLPLKTEPSSVDQKISLVDTFALTRNHFEKGSSTLTAAAETRFAKIASFFLKHESEWKEIHFLGHCDQRGSQELNKTLSQKRAARVKEVFIKSGLSPDRLLGFGFGFDKPLRNEENEAAWAENRRVEIEIHGPLEPDFVRKISAFIADLK